MDSYTAKSTTVPILINFDLSNYTLIHVNVTIENTVIDAVLDSGAAITLMNETLIHELNLPLKSIEAVNLVYGNESRDTTDMIARVSINFLNTSNIMDIYSAPNLPCKLLLGLNFFKLFKLHLDFMKDSVNIKTDQGFNEINKILIADINDKDSTITEPNITMRANDDYYLAPNSETLIELESSNIQSGTCLLQPHESIINNYGIFFCDSLSEIISGNTRVPLINTNPFPVLIIKNQAIASIIDTNKNIRDAHDQEILIVNKGDRNNFNINESLPLDQQKRIRTLLKEHQKVFAYSMEELTQTHLYEHSIQLIDGAKPVYARPIKMSAYEEELVDQNTDSMYKANLIEPAVSPFSSRMMLIRKPGNTKEWRVVNDFRALNKITVRDVYLLPRASTVLNELGGHTYYSTLDMFSGYFQIPLSPESRQYTAFLTPTNLWQYRVLPMGCMNSGSAFSRLMSLAFQSMKKDTITWYLDDIAVLGKNFDHHMENLEKVLKRLIEVNLKLKPSKCFFARQKIKFLGYEIDQNGIKPNMDKIKAITQMPTPKNGAETLSFLGCINFYRKHIQNFSIIASPLYHLTKKTTLFNWSIECQTAFDHFKKVLTCAPILALYDESLPVILESDASKVGVGGIIAQVKDGKEVVLEYHSRCTNIHEKKYSATELELLGIIFIVSQARTYVFGKHFKIITDHSCLQYLSNLKSPFGRLARWYTYLSEFDFEIIHRPGRKNTNVDCLSRLPINHTIPEGQDTDLQDRLIFLSTSVKEIMSKEKIIKAQNNDEYCNKIKKEMQLKTIGRTSTFKIKDGLLMKNILKSDGLRELIVLPIPIKDELIKIFHDQSAHEMGLKTFLKMRTRYYHPHLFKIINAYCKSCDKCQKRNPITTQPAGSSDLMPTSHIPMEKISIDLMGKLPVTSNGNQYIMVVVDIGTRFVIAKPIKNKTMGDVANCLLNEVFYTFGWPKLITSDRGKEFLNSLFKELTNMLGIEHHKTTAYHPNSNSIVERANRNLGIAIAKRVNKYHDNWDSILQAVVFGLNTSVHTITGQIPFTLLFNGRDITVATDMMFPPSNRNLAQHRSIIKELRENAEKRIKIQQFKTMERRNEHLIDDQFKVGDLCLVKRPLFKEGLSKKFMDRFTGPWEVIEVVKDGLFKLKLSENEEKEQVVNLTNLRRYYEREKYQGKEPAVGENRETLLNPLESNEKLNGKYEQEVQSTEQITEKENENKKGRNEKIRKPKTKKVGSINEEIIDENEENRNENELNENDFTIEVTEAIIERPQGVKVTVLEEPDLHTQMGTSEDNDSNGTGTPNENNDSGADSTQTIVEVTDPNESSSSHSTSYYDAQESTNENNEDTDSNATIEEQSDEEDIEASPIPPPRRSTRERKAPERLNFGKFWKK